MHLNGSINNGPIYIGGGVAKNDSKLDFDYKSVSQIQPNAKITQKPSEIKTVPLKIIL